MDSWKRQQVATRIAGTGTGSYKDSWINEPGATWIVVHKAGNYTDKCSMEKVAT
jgi:hypothetical protein